MASIKVIFAALSTLYAYTHSSYKFNEKNGCKY